MWKRMAVDHDVKRLPCSGGEELFGRDLLQFIDAMFVEPESGQDPARVFGGVIRRRGAKHGAALDAGLVKQPFGSRHCHQGTDFLSAAGFTEYGYVSRIAAKTRDVVAHPFERGDQI